MPSKKILRQHIRQKRQSLSQHEVTQYSSEICHRIIASKVYKNAACIGCYIAFQNEVDLTTLIQHAWQNQKTVCIPVVTSDAHMTFHLYTKETFLKSGKFGIPEPQHEKLIEPQQIDLLLVPLVAFDEKGNRLGQGCGFYDRYLEIAPQNTVTIGVGYELQKVNELPIDPWDIRLNKIISEKGSY